MSQKITEKYYVDTAIVPQTVNNTNVTGHYYSIAGVRRILLIGLGGAAAATKTFKLELLEATDDEGTSAQSVDSATGTANTKVKELTVATGSAAVTDVITINGTDFTMAAAEDTDANEWDDADSLASQINSDVAGVTASNSTGTITITADEGYYITATKTENSGTFTIATTEWTVILELNEIEGDFDSDYPFVAPKITTTGNGIYGAVIVLEKEILPVTQKVAAS